MLLVGIHWKNIPTFSITLSSKSAKSPPTLISAAVSNGNGFSGSVASKITSIGILGFDLAKGTKRW